MKKTEVWKEMGLIRDVRVVKEILEADTVVEDIDISQNVGPVW